MKKRTSNLSYAEFLEQVKQDPGNPWEEVARREIIHLETENKRLRKKCCACEFDPNGRVVDLCKAHGDYFRDLEKLKQEGCDVADKLGHSKD